jgi:hypothetical protein
MPSQWSLLDVAISAINKVETLVYLRYVIHEDM